MKEDQLFHLTINAERKFEFEAVPETIPLPPENKHKMKNINTPIFVFNVSDVIIVFFHSRIKKYEEKEAPSYGDIQPHFQAKISKVKSVITLFPLSLLW